MEGTEFLLIFFVTIQAHFVIGRPSQVIETFSPSYEAYREADQFLTSYGYYPSSGLLPTQAQKSSLRNHSETERTKALKLFQKFSNLPQSGQLDKETTQLMQSPRCGNPDITSNLNTMGTSADLDMEEEEDVSETMKDHTSQETEESRVNVDREKRSLDMSRKKRMKRQEKHKPIKWKAKFMRWSLDRDHRLDDEEKHREVAKKAFSYWDPLVPFKFIFQEESYRNQQVADPRLPPDLFISFHDFRTNHPMNYGEDENYVNVKGWDNGTNYLEPYLEEKGMLDQLERRRRHKRELKRFTDAERKSIKETYRKWYAEVMRKQNREELDKHNSARRMNRTKIERPKNAQTRKGRDYSYAHARLPILKERHRFIHFDDSYDWSSDEFYQVLLHEIGHILGLGHSNKRASIMNANNLGVREFSLSDLRTIRKLYGVRNGMYLCDANLRELRNMFKAPIPEHEGTYYYTITGRRVQYLSENENDRIRTYYPFEKMFPGVPSNYDLVFPTLNKTIIFIFLNSTTIPGGKLIRMRHLAKGKTLVKELKFGERALPEIPKFAVTINNEAGGSRTRMFGATRSWDFELKGIRRPGIVYYHEERLEPSLADFLRPVTKVAVLTNNSLIFVLRRDGRYAVMDAHNATYYEEVVKGYPPWIRLLMCKNQAASERPASITSHGHSNKEWGMSTPGIMLVIMLSLITLY